MSSVPSAPDDGGADAAFVEAGAGAGTAFEHEVTDESGDDEGIDAVTESTARPGGTDVAEQELPEPVVSEANEPVSTEVAAPRVQRTVAVRKGGKRAPRTKPDRTPAAAQPAPAELAPIVLELADLTKRYGDTIAVDRVSLQVREGSFYGIIGPNGAGKTTTLSMMTGLLRPDSGSVTVHDVDVWADPSAAKKLIGVLPDRLRLFDRLTGAQLLYYAATLRGLDRATARTRTTELATALGLEDALGRIVSDYSAGMAKKVALAAGMIHAPRILVLDEPFESVDPVSASNVIEVLKRYVASGGTVVLSSHGMDFIERVCDSVAIIVGGEVLAAGTVAEVSGGATLEERFRELAGSGTTNEGLEWLHDFSD